MSATVAGDGNKDGFALASGASVGGAVALLCDGEPRDLSSVPPAGAEVELITQNEEWGREITRHSTAHVLAQAVLRLHPEAKYTIGPPIENGFYYDFDVERPFTPDDLEEIEAEMRKIIKENQRFEREEVTREQALELFADQPYKIEIIETVARGDTALDQEADDSPVLSVYRNRNPGQDGVGSVAFIDLCRGPHLPGTGRIKAFKLLRSSGAYWRGDETKPMLQRIYGTAWESKDALQDYLHRLEEAERRDHRKIGRDLELYSWSEEVGPGLALWHPNGARSRMILEDLSRQMHLERGYQPVFTPHIGKGTLWETSGHLGFFRENMFPPMEGDEGEYFARPMNCPFHILIYRSKTRSYRELPVRLNELGTVYRYERSGTVHGILRARGLTMDDAHIFCRPDQVVDELVAVVDFLRDLYGTVGLSPDAVRFSTKPEKAVGSPELWTLAEDAIREGLTRAGLDYTISEGEGAFYGPKIDVDVRDAIGRYWQLCTIQVDFQEPDRFELEYIDEHGERQRPVMLHRALFGSVERFFGVLVEHFAGAFPTWLAPLQVAIIPIADRHSAYAHEVAARLQPAGIRVEIDDSTDTMGAKIRRSQLHKVPYMLVVGDEEASAGTVSVRRRTGEEIRGVTVDDLVGKLKAEVESRSLDLTV
jgi:threonyl-tRNA synthetase